MPSGMVAHRGLNSWCWTTEMRSRAARALAAEVSVAEQPISDRMFGPSQSFCRCMMPGCKAWYLKLVRKGSSCCVQRQCICQTRYLEGTKSTVCVCIGGVGRPPHVERFESRLKAAPGAMYLSLRCLWQCRCVAILWQGLLGLARFCSPTRNIYPDSM